MRVINANVKVFGYDVVNIHFNFIGMTISRIDTYGYDNKSATIFQ